MKLLVVSSWLPYPPDNGSRLRAFHLLQRLSRKHTLTLFSLGIPGEPDDVAQLRALCDRVEVVAPTPVLDDRLGFRGLLSPVPRHLVQTESPRMTALVAEAAGAHDAGLALQVEAARYLEPCASVPRVFEEVEVTVYREQYLLEQQLSRRLRHGMTWWKFRRFIRRLVNSFDRSTVVSAQEREHLREIGCDVARVGIVPNGIEASHVCPPVIRAERLIYPGSVVYSANLDAVQYFVRDVFPILRRQRPTLEFWVTGSTEGADISDLEVPGVTFTGRLPEVDGPIAESAVCVVPLRIGGGTRLKVLQAMAVGTPVVSTTKGVEGLDVEDGRHALIADSPDAFAQQVQRLLDEPALGRQVAGHARRLVQERYNWGSISALLEEVIARAVADFRLRGERRSQER